MNNMKKPICFTLLIAMLAVSLIFTGCSNAGSDSSDSDVTYTVTVNDMLGKACASGTVVKFMQNGEQKAMITCDESGVASKTLPKGDYTAELAFTGSEKGFYYEKAAELTAENNSARIILSQRITTDAFPLYDHTGEQVKAYDIVNGCTYAELEPGKRNYFIYTPLTTGEYRFTVANADDAEIGYYGTPYFVQNTNIAEAKENGFNISVNDGMIGVGEGGTSAYVIGIDAKSNESCIICIERIGDPIKTINDEPWIIYKKTVEVKKYTLPEDVGIKEFDLTAKTEDYNLIFNASDGFYHIGSENGPLVLVRLTKDCDYIDCYKTILENVVIVKYFFNDEGEFVKRENYSECLSDYIKCADDVYGVYPLTNDLKYIIQNHGGYSGWWDPDNITYLFKDKNGYNIPEINNEIAWLLMCCYAE